MPFKLIYTADLHGNKGFYKRLLKKAEEESVNAIVIGGDLCGREGSSIEEKIENQKLFLEEFMIPLFGNFKKENRKIEFYIIMGNDDFRINLEVLEKAGKSKILKSIHKKSVKLSKFLNIAGYSFVNPTPFRLKDWEKFDFESDKMPAQMFMEEITSTEREKGNIADDLKNLKKLSSPKKTIYAVHAPPFSTKLDMITASEHVGSKAVRQFIEKEQPPLTLHGHIHESPKMSGSWLDKIGNTACINVGSSYPEDKLNCVIVDENLDAEYFEI